MQILRTRAGKKGMTMFHLHSSNSNRRVQIDGVGGVADRTNPLRSMERMIGGILEVRRKERRGTGEREGVVGSSGSWAISQVKGYGALRRYFAYLLVPCFILDILVPRIFIHGCVLHCVCTSSGYMAKAWLLCGSKSIEQGVPAHIIASEKSYNYHIGKEKNVMDEKVYCSKHSNLIITTLFHISTQ
jgi:hypothetical protein